jgi:hypothetical protein
MFLHDADGLIFDDKLPSAAIHAQIGQGYALLEIAKQIARLADAKSEE